MINDNTDERRGGQALILTFLFVLIVLALSAVVVKEVQLNLRVARMAEHRLAAEYLAESGLEVALHQFNEGDWIEREPPFEWDSREAGGNLRLSESFATPPKDQWIHLRVERVPMPERYAQSLGRQGGEPSIENRQSETNYPLFRVTSTGHVRGHRYTRTRFLNDASDLYRYVRNIYHFDFDVDRPRREATTTLGDGGVGVAGYVEERLQAPTGGRAIQVAAVGDPQFGGLVPEREFLLDETGEPLRRSDAEFLDQASQSERVRQDSDGKSSLGPGEYLVEYPTGSFQFHPSEAGKAVILFYDYYHRVPRPAGPFTLALPYPPMQANTDRVSDAGGIDFYRDAARPRIMNHYAPDYERALLYCTEHNTNQPLIADYSFLGSRMTGGLRMNGQLRWTHRNLIYLNTSRQEKVEVTGGFQYTPGARVVLSDERGETVSVATNGSANDQPLALNCYHSQASYHLPPFVGQRFYGQRSNSARGGAGLHLANSEERESLPSFETPQGRMISTWASATAYQPVGRVVDLARLRGSASQVLAAEGNLRLVGALPRGLRVTVVSGGDLYVEDYLTPPSAEKEASDPSRPNAQTPGHPYSRTPPSSLALIAAGNVCLNLTAPAFRHRRPDVYFLRALVWARQGTFGIIPGQRDVVARGKRTQFFLLGSVNENAAYSNREWARAFSRLEWVYDPSLRHPERRPPYLFAWVSHNEPRT